MPNMTQPARPLNPPAYPHVLPPIEADDAGQAAIPLVLILGIFLLAMLGFAIDLTNVWYHRQAAQAAADAACQAGALDMYAQTGGVALTPGFTAGTASDCAHSSSATMCKYAGFNGYNGAGLVANTPSNAVSWTFPASINGVTPGAGAYPFMQVLISERIKTYLMSLLNITMTNISQYETISVTSHCGIAQVQEAAPMVVLNPTASAAFNYSGTGTLEIQGGPGRGLQVNSSSPTGVSWSGSALIDLSKGGVNGTGSDIGLVGGPATNPTNGSSFGYNGGTTGNWKPKVLPTLDPFANVPPPASQKFAPNYPGAQTTNGGNWIWVNYKVDGCPDNSQKNYPTTNECIEYQPGYYPTGINPVNNYSTVMFHPGVYYLNGSINIGGSTTLRVSKPDAGHQQTDGVMFYFLTGGLNISGGSGQASSTIDNVKPTDLTCDGSAPPASLGLPSSLTGNVLYSMCTNKGTYYDTGNDSSDSRGTVVRGLLVFYDHSNPQSLTISGGGSLAYAGSLYLHCYIASGNASNYTDQLNLSGGTSSGSFILGEVITDEVLLSGSGVFKLALSNANVTPTSKVGVFQ